MTREEFDNLLVELSSAHVKWDTRFNLLAVYDDLVTQRDNFRERCADLESRLDIGTGNMYDVVVLENKKLRGEIETLKETIRDNEAYFMEQKHAAAVLYANMQMERKGSEALRAQLESEQAANREHVQQARRLIEERDALIMAAQVADSKRIEAEGREYELRNALAKIRDTASRNSTPPGERTPGEG